MLSGTTKKQMNGTDAACLIANTRNKIVEGT
jgi:hypothetical protein